MPWVRMHSEVYGSVSMCLCVCVCRLLQLLNDKCKSLYRLLVAFSWIAICGFANASFSSYS